jgi:TPR repeat protein
MYFNGSGIEQSDVMALMFWILASENGDKIASNYKALISDPGQMAEAQRLARDWVGAYQ